MVKIATYNWSHDRMDPTARGKTAAFENEFNLEITSANELKPVKY